MKFRHHHTLSTQRFVDLLNAYPNDTDTVYVRYAYRQPDPVRWFLEFNDRYFSIPAALVDVFVWTDPALSRSYGLKPLTNQQIVTELSAHLTSRARSGKISRLFA